MKRSLSVLKRVFLILVLFFSLVACDGENTVKGSISKEFSDMQNSVVKVIEHMDAVIAPVNLENEEFKESPWIQSQVEVDGIDSPISLDVVEGYLNAYQFYTGEDLEYGAKDLINLLNEEDKNIYDSFQDFYGWLGNNGTMKHKMYSRGVDSAYLAYEKAEEAFQGKELVQLNANDEYELALWAVENSETGETLDEEDQKDFQTLVNAYKSDEK